MKKLGTIILGLGLLTTSAVFAAENNVAKVLYSDEAYLVNNFENKTTKLASSTIPANVVKALYSTEAYIKNNLENKTHKLASSTVSQELIDELYQN